MKARPDPGQEWMAIDPDEPRPSAVTIFWLFVLIAAVIFFIGLLGKLSGNL